MISRYTFSEIGNIWTDEYKFNTWLKIEILTCEALSKKGKIPYKALQVIKKKSGFNINRINKIESEVKHDIIAFLTSVSEKLVQRSRYVHLGLTSSDLLDTALAIQLRESANLIESKLNESIKILKAKSKIQ